MQFSKQLNTQDRSEDIFMDSIDDIISMLNAKKDMSFRNLPNINQSIDFDVGEVLNHKENKNYKELDIFSNLTDQLNKKPTLTVQTTKALAFDSKASTMDVKSPDVEINKLGKVLEEQDENRFTETIKLAIPEQNMTIHPKFGL